MFFKCLSFLYATGESLSSIVNSHSSILSQVVTLRSCRRLSSSKNKICLQTLKDVTILKNRKINKFEISKRNENREKLFARHQMCCKVIFLSTEIRKTLYMVINQYSFPSHRNEMCGILIFNIDGA